MRRVFDNHPVRGADAAARTDEHVRRPVVMFPRQSPSAVLKTWESINAGMDSRRDTRDRISGS